MAGDLERLIPSANQVNCFEDLNAVITDDVSVYLTGALDGSSRNWPRT